jgi:hypothetical protein
MAELPVYRHPLAALRVSLGNLSASAYLDLLDRRHRELGFGAMATRREKVARWESGACARADRAARHGQPARRQPRRRPGTRLAPLAAAGL